MSTINRAFIAGRLGRDPEVRRTGSGLAIANLNIATNERKKDKSGEWTDEVEWHRIVTFGKTAEVCEAHLHKGSGVTVEGRLRTREWKDKDGNKRWNTEIVSDSIVFGGGGQERKEKRDDYGSDDDIPF